MEWLQQTLAIGDGENDMEMLRFDGYGIAMGNSGEALKSHACYVTEDNDNQGVEAILERIIPVRGAVPGYLSEGGIRYERSRDTNS